MNNLYPATINSRSGAAWRLLFALSTLALSLFFVSCGGGGSDTVLTCQPYADSFGRPVTCSAPLAPKYTLGGSVNVFPGTVELASNGQTVSVSPVVIVGTSVCALIIQCPQNTFSFTFPTPLAAGTNYNVTVKTQPSGKICSVSNGEGVIGNSDVTSVVVSCTNPVASKYSTVGSYPITDCVKDNSTGLIWEGKPTSGLRASANTYTNYDSTTAFQIWNSSTPPTQAQINATTNSIGYVNAVNAAGLCGFTSGWRLPTLVEMQGLVIAGSAPTIDAVWFPNTQSNWYWTSSPDAGYPTYAWDVSFSVAGAFYGSRDSYDYLRLVR
jgi:hypothetical protein